MTRTTKWTTAVGIAVAITATGVGTAYYAWAWHRLAPGTRAAVIGDHSDATTAPMRDKASKLFNDGDGYDRGFVIRAGETVTVLGDTEDSVFDATRWVRIAHPDPKGGWTAPAVQRRNLAPIR